MLRLTRRLPPATGPRCSLALLLALPLMGQPLTASSSSVTASRQVSVIERSREPLPEARGSALSVAAAGEEGPYRITPERRALLNTIRYAEGTWIGGSEEGYRVLYGGGRFLSLERHPEITVQRRYVSAAAGAYQFLPRTWDAAARTLGLRDFGPASQDQAALYLVEQRGALQRFDRSGLCAEVLARLAPEWASLPSHHGGSYYGQPVKGVGELLAFYGRELERQRERARTGSLSA